MLIEPEDNEDEHFVDAGMPKKAGESSKAPKNDVQEYDGKKREPQFAHADSSCLWELVSEVLAWKIILTFSSPSSTISILRSRCKLASCSTPSP